jgi:hypothetical protein
MLCLRPGFVVAISVCSFCQRASERFPGGHSCDFDSRQHGAQGHLNRRSGEGSAFAIQQKVNAYLLEKEGLGANRSRRGWRGCRGTWE